MSTGLAFYGEVVHDAWQLVRREAPRVLTLSGVLSLLPHVWQWLCRYWRWVFAAAVVRRVLVMLRRMLWRKRDGRGHRHHHHCRHGAEGGGNGSSVSSANTTFDRNSYFSCTSAPPPPAPSTPSRLLVGDDVIVVDRDGRYVEVYERKASSSSAGRDDDIDAKVTALLRSFERRTRS